MLDNTSPHYMPKSVCKHKEQEKSHQNLSQAKISQKNNNPKNIKTYLKAQEKLKTHLKRRKFFVKIIGKLLYRMKKLNPEHYDKKHFQISHKI